MLLRFLHAQLLQQTGHYLCQLPEAFKKAIEAYMKEHPELKNHRLGVIVQAFRDADGVETLKQGPRLTCVGRMARLASMPWICTHSATANGTLKELTSLPWMASCSWT